MDDMENMSRSDLWNKIKDLKESGVEIDVTWASSKKEMIEALEKIADEKDCFGDYGKYDYCDDCDQIAECFEEFLLEDEDVGIQEEEEIKEEIKKNVEKIKVIRKPIVVKKKKKKATHKTLSKNDDISGVKIGDLVKFKCKFWRGSQQKYATIGLIVSKFGKTESYEGRLTPIIRKWIKTKRIKLVRWN